MTFKRQTTWLLLLDKQMKPSDAIEQRMFCAIGHLMYPNGQMPFYHPMAQKCSLRQECHLTETSCSSNFCVTFKSWETYWWVLCLRFKGIVHFEIKNWYVSAYPKGIQDVGVFFSSVDPILMFLGQTVLVCQSYNGRYRSLSLWEGKRTCTEKFKLNNSPS